MAEPSRSVAQAPESDAQGSIETAPPSLSTVYGPYKNASLPTSTLRRAQALHSKHTARAQEGSGSSSIRYAHTTRTAPEEEGSGSASIRTARTTRTALDEERSVSSSIRTAHTTRTASLTDALHWIEPHSAAVESIGNDQASAYSPPADSAGYQSSTHSRPFMCPIQECSRRFTRAYDARRHIRRTHGEMNAEALIDAFETSARSVHVCVKCKDCGATFGSHGALHSHSKTRHATTQARRRHGFQCDYCPLLFPQMRGCLTHMIETHPSRLRKDAAFERRTFPTTQAFEAWLGHEERLHPANYTTRHRSLTPTSRHASAQSSLPSTIVWMTEQRVCSRARALPRSAKFPRRSRAAGDCRARMFVQYYTNGHVNVDLYRRHAHELELRHVRLPEVARETIRFLAVEGLSPTKILDRVASDLAHDQRATCLRYDDVYRVARHYDPSVLAPRDQGSVAMRVRALNGEAGGERTVRALKLQGDNDFCIGDGPPGGASLKAEHFVLIYQSPWQREQLQRFGKDVIYLDATHGSNAYKFNLTNIVIAASHATVAVAHMVSDSLQSWVIERFLRDTVCAHQVAPRYVVTDDDNAEFKAITCMLPKAQHRLCQIHIPRNWKKTLPKKASTARVAKTARDDLIALMRVTDADKFETAWCLFKERYANERPLVDYAEERYYQRKYKWASCFSHPTSANTTNAVESFHNRFKAQQLNRRANLRIDRLLFALMKNDRQQQRTASTNFALGRPSRVVAAAAAARKAAKGLHAVREADGSYEVGSGSTADKKCRVALSDGPACGHCDPEVACVHAYWCQCTVYQRSDEPRVCNHTAAAFQKEYGQDTDMTVEPTSVVKKAKLSSCKGANKDAVIRDLENLLQHMHEAEFIPPSIAECIQRARTMTGIARYPAPCSRDTFLTEAVATDWRAPKQPDIYGTRRRRKWGPKTTAATEDGKPTVVELAMQMGDTSTVPQGSKGQGGRPPGDTSTVPQGSKGQGGRPPGDTSTVPQGSKGQGGRPPGHGPAGLGCSPSVLLLQRVFPGRGASS